MRPRRGETRRRKQGGEVKIHTKQKEAELENETVDVNPQQGLRQKPREGAKMSVRFKVE